MKIKFEFEPNTNFVERKPRHFEGDFWNVKAKY